MIIEDFMMQICVPLENSAYFGAGDGVDSTPEYIFIFLLNNLAHKGLKHAIILQIAQQ